MVWNPPGPQGSAREFALIAIGLAGLALVAGLSPAAMAGDNPTPLPNAIPVIVDILPGLRPNHLRIESSLTIPVAILGTMDFDVTNIDPATVRLARDGEAGGCEPAGWAYADVGSPVIGASPDCNSPRGDGLDDLKLDFSIPDLAVKLGLGAYIGETVSLVLSAKLVTGQGIEGADSAVVISGAWEGDGAESEIGLLASTERGRVGGRFDFAYYTNVSDRTTFTIYDVRGRAVAKLNDMDMTPGIYRAAWDGKDRNGREVPAGTYFARVSNSWTSATRKIVVLE